MFEAQTNILSEGRIRKLEIFLNGEALRFSNALNLWQADESFRTFYISVLADAPFTAFRWETPPVTSITMERPFEFVLLDSPGLARTPDREAFAEYFSAAPPTEAAIAFENLGRDATLVVPCPRGPGSAYGHLAAFTRHAPTSQNHALWQKVGKAMIERVSNRPVWLSTAGAGVSWLHVRLDSRPKYYGFAPYRENEIL